MKVEGPLLEYSVDDVDDGRLIAFHARSSSNKEKINLNKNLMAFMLHDQKLFYWKGLKGVPI